MVKTQQTPCPSAPVPTTSPPTPPVGQAGQRSPTRTSTTGWTILQVDYIQQCVLHIVIGSLTSPWPGLSVGWSMCRSVIISLKRAGSYTSELLSDYFWIIDHIHTPKNCVLIAKINRYLMKKENICIYTAIMIITKPIYLLKIYPRNT